MTTQELETRVRGRLNAYMQGVTDELVRIETPAGKRLSNDEDYQRGRADVVAATRELRGRLRDRALGQIAAVELAFADVAT